MLDLVLPGIDGLEVCRQLREFTDAYIIILTSRADEVDKVLGLSFGADDYLTKPFSARELSARIAAMLRRPRMATAEADTTPRSYGAVAIDPSAREATVDGESVPAAVDAVVWRGEDGVVSISTASVASAYRDASSPTSCTTFCTSRWAMASIALRRPPSMRT